MMMLPSQASGEAYTGAEKIGISPEEIREVFYLQNDIDDLELSVKALKEVPVLVGIEPVHPTTLDEVQRIITAFRGQQTNLVGKMMPEQREKYDRILEEKKQFATELDEKVSQNFPKISLIGRINLDQPVDETTASQIATYRLGQTLEITPKVIQASAKLDIYSTVLLNRAYNIGAHRTQEELGTLPLNEEAMEDLVRIHQTVGERGNQINAIMEDSQKGQRKILVREFFDFRNKVKFTPVQPVFEKEFGIPFHVPLDERLELRTGVSPAEIARRKAAEEAERVATQVQPEAKRKEICTRNCPTCGKSFQSIKADGECYDCTLESITHGMSPEEGDFNTAKIISGTLTPEEAECLRQDLESVETGRSRSNL